MLRGLLAPRGDLPEFLQADGTHLYHRGRFALLHGLRSLKLPSGAGVAIPSFHCGLELDALDHLGLRPNFYEINERLQVDQASLGAAVDGETRAVLVTHYFGLPQNMAVLQDFCRERGLRLIEDCAHTLEARQDGQLLGTFGDVAIFSMHKLLPVPDGGALLVNSPDLEPPTPTKTGSWRITRDFLQKDLVRWRASSGPKRRQSTIVDRRLFLRLYPGLMKFSDSNAYLRQRRAEWHGLNAERLDWSIARLSLRVLRASDCSALRRRRRTNYAHLAEQLIESEEIRVPVAGLPEGCCPLALPVLVTDPRGLMGHMLDHGIETGPFWSSAHPLFPAREWPRGACLSDRVVPLPIHQQLDEAAVERVARVVNAWSAERRAN